MKKFALALTLSLVLTSCSSPVLNESSESDESSRSSVTDEEEYVVRVGYGSSLCHAPLHAAMEKGFFEAEGLKYEAIKLDTAVMADAAASGQIDTGYGLVGKFIQPLENGLPIQLTAGIHTGCIKLVAAQDSPINDLTDLRGKRIGVGALADSPALIAKRALANVGVGITPDNLEVEFLVFPNADLPTALENGAIDAFAAPDPLVSVAIEEYGLKTLVDTAEDAPFKDEYCCFSFVTNDFAQKRPDLAAKYTAALIKAAEWVGENPEEAAELQVEKEYVSGEAAFNATLLSAYSFKASAKNGRDALASVVYALDEIGALNQNSDKEALIENSFTVFGDI
ncbi:MAG: ABC transporter substrate-binding protein [Clostridiales bacterium]|jgi:NitT/TauT family transport system substrate-binding protein|nr:ABC transporter substrate-binding protein [Clostridiales bacterium]